ncbi:hypothetical protein KK062_29505 [Fulvivirgaceae bacterium PWU5]|uniref:Uncharacterized protein n=1 Tax=Dawidia cretensis TaxID=2782350 RepID=A0AAP2E3J0_9BACT|nr:hypothetical protein [Dawidia cretensis]MBT1712415.1 hypothetical protein [Dawidia cretensis]
MKYFYRTLLLFFVSVTSLILLSCGPNLGSGDKIILHNDTSFGTSVDLALSPTGKEAALANETDILVYQLSDGIVAGSFPYEYPHQVDKFSYQRPAKVILFANDSQNVLVLSNSGAIDVREKRTGDVIQVVKVPDSNITAMEFSRDRQQLLLGTGWGSLYVLDANDYTIQKRFALPAGASVVSVAANKNVLLASTHDSTIHVLDIHTGTVQKTLKGASANLYSLDISQDNRTVVGAMPRNREKSLYGEAVFWNLETGNIIYRSHDDYTQVLRAKFTANDKHVIVGFSDGIMIYKPDGSIDQHIGHFVDPEVVFDLLPDQNTIATIECDYGTGTDNIKSINIDTRTIENVVQETPSVLWGAEMSPDNKKFMFIQTGFVKSFDLETDQLEQPWMPGSLWNGRFSYHKKWMMASARNPADNAVYRYVFSVADNTRMLETDAADVSPLLKYAVTAVYDQALRGQYIRVSSIKEPSTTVWDNKAERSSPGGYPTYEFTSVDDILLYSYDRDQDITLQSIIDSSRHITFPAQPLVYTDDAVILYQHNHYQTEYKSIVVFNLKTFKVENEIPITSGRPEKAVLDSKNQLYLWSGTTVEIYDLTTMMAVRQVTFVPEFLKSEQDFMVSPNGKTFVVCSRYGVIEFFDAQTGKSKAALFPRHSEKNDYVLINNEFQWTASDLGIRYMLHIKNGDDIVAPEDLQNYRKPGLLKSLLVD